MMMTGSGGMSLAKHLDVSFIQEVVASTKVTKLYYKEVDVAIELEAKMLKSLTLKMASNSE